jgi:hypothetical protein
MVDGAVAFLDCLGFKGIWRTQDPEAVLANLCNAERALAQDLRSFEILQRVNVRYAFISDTIVIGASLQNAERMTDTQRGALVLAAAMGAENTVKFLIRGEPPLTVRGCVTSGKFLIEGSHIIGPAIDEAATMHEAANGAFVWMLPELWRCVEANLQLMQGAVGLVAEDVMRQHLRTNTDARWRALADRPLDQLRGMLNHVYARISEETFLPHDVPLKGGSMLSARVLNPFAGSRHIDSVLDRYRNAMTSTALDVVVKRQNTLRFLEYAASVTRRISAERPDLMQ